MRFLTTFMPASHSEAKHVATLGLLVLVCGTGKRSNRHILSYLTELPSVQVFCHSAEQTGRPEILAHRPPSKTVLELV